MANEILLFGSLLISLSMRAQETGVSIRKVPNFVLNYIDQNFPKAEHKRFYLEKIENDSLIECDFSVNKRNYSLTFQDDILVEFERSITFNEITDSIQQKIKKNLNLNFSDYQLIECEEVNPGSKLLYEINIKSKGVFYELIYTEQGEFLFKKEEIIEPVNTSF